MTKFVQAKNITDDFSFFLRGLVLTPAGLSVEGGPLVLGTVSSMSRGSFSGSPGPVSWEEQGEVTAERPAETREAPRSLGERPGSGELDTEPPVPESEEFREPEPGD